MRKPPKGAAHESALHCDRRDVDKWVEPHRAASSFLTDAELKVLWYSELAARRYADICKLTDTARAERERSTGLLFHLDQAQRFIEDQGLLEQLEELCEREREDQHAVGDEAAAGPPLSRSTVERFNNGERIL